MKLPNRADWTVILTGAAGALSLATWVVLWVKSKSPHGLIHDSAYVLITPSLPIGGFGGALLGWIALRIVQSNIVPFRAVGRLGCFGTAIAWLLFGAILSQIDRTP